MHKIRIKLKLGLYKEYGPQDIEFAVKGDKPFILQARPITTLIKQTINWGHISFGITAHY